MEETLIQSTLSTRILKLYKANNGKTSQLYSNHIILKLPPGLTLKVFSTLIDVTQSPFGLTRKAIYALAENFNPFKFTKSPWCLAITLR